MSVSVEIVVYDDHRKLLSIFSEGDCSSCTLYP